MNNQVNSIRTIKKNFLVIKNKKSNINTEDPFNVFFQTNIFNNKNKKQGEALFENRSLSTGKKQSRPITRTQDAIFHYINGQNESIKKIYNEGAETKLKIKYQYRSKFDDFIKDGKSNLKEEDYKYSIISKGTSNNSYRSKTIEIIKRINNHRIITQKDTIALKTHKSYINTDNYPGTDYKKEISLNKRIFSSNTIDKGFNSENRQLAILKEHKKALEIENEIDIWSKSDYKDRRALELIFDKIIENDILYGNCLKVIKEYFTKDCHQNDTLEILCKNFNDQLFKLKTENANTIKEMENTLLISKKSEDSLNEYIGMLKKENSSLKNKIEILKNNNSKEIKLLSKDNLEIERDDEFKIITKKSINCIKDSLDMPKIELSVIHSNECDYCKLDSGKSIDIKFELPKN